jgi:hypothetical protein
MVTTVDVGKYEHMEESSCDLPEVFAQRGLRKTHSENIWYPSQDLNCAAPEYKSDILPPEPTGLVKFM